MLLRFTEDNTKWFIKLHIKQDHGVTSQSSINYMAVLASLPWSTVAPLQRVQNAAAHLVLGLSPRDHVSPALLELHWLPLYYRIQFKLGLLMYMAHNGQSPMYISDALTPVSRVQSCKRLRSADTTDYLVPRTRSKFGERAFCVSGPLAWNSLPESLRTVDSITPVRFVVGLALNIQM